MKNRHPIAFVSIFFVLVIALNACAPKPESVASPAAVTTATSSALSAMLSEITGKVETRQADQNVFSPAQLNSFLNVNGQALTGTDGRIRLDLSTGTIIRVAPNSLFTLASNEAANGSLNTRVELAIGKLFIILSGGSTQVETPTGTAAVRGSYMSVSYDPNSGETRVTCLEGHCTLSNAFGSVEITAGQTAIITAAGQPPQIGEMSAEDIQAWLNDNPEAGLVAAELTNETAATEVPPATDIPPMPNTPTPIPSPVVILPPIIINDPVEEDDPETTDPTLVPIVVITNISPAGSVTGQPLAIGISVMPSLDGPTPTGTVKVFANGNAICTASLVEGDAVCVGGIFTVGSFSLVAKYLGNASYLAAQSAPVTGFEVTKATTTTTITSHVPNPSVTGQAVVFTATVDVDSPGTGTPFGSVTFSTGSGDHCTVTAAPWTCSITFSISGMISVTATYSGDAKFNGSYSFAEYQNVTMP